jgi:NitT/TauT family transport system ATP-binding protein
MISKIALEGVTHDFESKRKGGATRALDQVSLAIEPGSFVCLLGPSGCGKSTVLNLVAGFERPSQGSVLVDGNPVVGPGPDRGVVFQEALLLPWKNVLGNVTFGSQLAGRLNEQSLAQARHYLHLTGLDGFEDHATYELSGGMRQRVALARAWMVEPPVLLMDEPFGALDAQTRLSMQELLINIWTEARTTVLFVTHDVDEALFLADRIVVMSARPGRIIQDLPVPFARPRDYEALIREPLFASLKQTILHTVREQARLGLGVS